MTEQVFGRINSQMSDAGTDKHGTRGNHDQAMTDESTYVQVSVENDKIICLEGETRNIMSTDENQSSTANGTGDSNSASDAGETNNLTSNIVLMNKSKQILIKEHLDLKAELQFVTSNLTKVTHDKLEKEEELMDVKTTLGKREVENKELKEELVRTKEALSKQEAKLKEHDAVLALANSQKEQIGQLERDKKRMSQETMNQVALKQQAIDDITKLQCENRKTIQKQQEKITACEDENKKIAMEKRHLSDEVSKLKKTMEDDKVQYNADMAAKCVQIVAKEEEIQDQLQKVEKLTAECESQKLKIKAMSQEREELSQRLSEEWSKRISSDESNIENISIKNRPMNVANEYERMCSKEWLDAKNALDETVDDEDTKLISLCKVLEEALNIAETRHKKFIQNIVMELNAQVNDLTSSVDARADKCKSAESQTDVIAAGGNSGDMLISAPVTPNKGPGQNRHESMEIDEDDTEKFLNLPQKQANNNVDENQEHQNGNTPSNRTEESAGNTLNIDTKTYTIKRPPGVCTTKEGPSTSGLSSDSNGTPAKVRKATHSSEDVEIPGQISNAVEDYLRIYADKIDVRGITQDLVTCLNRNNQNQPWLSCLNSHQSLKIYVDSCANLAWKMVIQRPSMKFSTEGMYEKWSEKKQEPIYGSQDPKHQDSVVVYYVTPVLLHGDKVMTKGKVMIKILT